LIFTAVAFRNFILVAGGSCYRCLDQVNNHDDDQIDLKDHTVDWKQIHLSLGFLEVAEL